MSSFTDTIQDSAKEASARIADTAKVAGASVSEGARTASKKVSSASSSVADWVLTGAKLVPTIGTMLGYVGLQKKRSNVLGNSLSFSAGLLVGAGAGLLFAPKSGAETRAALRSYFQGTPAERVANDVVEKAETAANTVKEKASSVKENVKDKVDDMREHAGRNGSRITS